jgi:glycosyltransferase involved in cell wall biosynthesis
MTTDSLPEPVGTIPPCDARRILHIGKFYPPYRGGMESHLQLLCEELQRSVNLRVVVSSTSRDTTRETVNGVDVTRLGTALRFAGASISTGMRKCIADAGDALVHLHFPNPAAILAYLASGHRGPLVVTYHSDIVRQRILGSAFAPILDRFLRRCDGISVGSPNYIESSPTLQKFRDRCTVIPFGIDLAPFNAQHCLLSEQIRTQYGPGIILAVGRLVGYKGFEYLIEAMQKIDGHLLLVGTGPLRPQFEAQIARLGIGNRVTLLGEVDDVTPYHRAADVFVLPSVTRAEAFGIVQLEAMASGTPVVNTALDSGVPFVSIHGETGLTVPPRDAPALAAAVSRLLGDTELRHRLGTAARRRVELQFSAEAMVTRTLALYDSVLARRVVPS